MSDVIEFIPQFGKKKRFDQFRVNFLKLVDQLGGPQVVISLNPDNQLIRSMFLQKPPRVFDLHICLLQQLPQPLVVQLLAIRQNVILGSFFNRSLGRVLLDQVLDIGVLDLRRPWMVRCGPTLELPGAPFQRLQFRKVGRDILVGPLMHRGVERVCSFEGWHGLTSFLWGVPVGLVGASHWGSRVGKGPFFIAVVQRPSAYSYLFGGCMVCCVRMVRCYWGQVRSQFCRQAAREFLADLSRKELGFCQFCLVPHKDFRPPLFLLLKFKLADEVEVQATLEVQVTDMLNADGVQLHCQLRLGNFPASFFNEQLLVLLVLAQRVSNILLVPLEGVVF